MTITQQAPKRTHSRTPRTTARETRRRLSFIVPAPDYTATPEELYQAVRAQTEALDLDWEMLFIDHGHCERTWHLIQTLQRRDPQHVRAFIFCESRNRSAALALGYRECRGDLVFSLESDHCDDPRELPGFLERIEWHKSVARKSASNDPEDRWQNILPRGVLRSSGLSSAHAA